MVQDLAIAARTLLKRPGYALSVIATLTLGIGATTMMFSLLDGALLRPLPFPSSQLVMLTGVFGPQRSPRGGSFLEVADWRAMNRTLDDLSIYDETSVNLRIGTESVRVETEMVSASFFPLLGVSAAMGRTFLPEEDAVPDRQPVAIVSQSLWRERLGSDPEVFKRTIYLNDRPFQIVGVMPEGFAGLSFDTDLWVPSMMVSLTSSPAVVTDRGTRWLGALGRLKSDVAVPRAQEDLTRVAGLLEQQYPDVNRQRGVDVTPLRQALLGGTGGLVLTLFAAVLLFLVVACANVASLQLARAAARQRDLAVRLALGARRWHVLRALMAESLLLSVAAGLFGALAAAWTLGAVVRLMPEGALPRHVQPAVDLRALGFTLLVTLVVGALVAILPGLAGRRRDLSNTMKEGARFAGPGLGSIRRPSAQQLLVGAEIALAMTLLIAAGLMVRSLERQMQVAIGFETRGVTVARLSLPGERYSAPQRIAFVERLADSLRSIPRVESASIGTSLPFTGNSSAGLLLPDVAPSAEATVRYYRNMVTPAFFSTLGIRVLAGRGFTDQDRQGAPLVAVVNESGAKRIWGGQGAVGRHVKSGAGTIEIVGVVEDARFRDLTSDLRGAKSEPDLYFPYAQRTDRDIEIAVRSADGSAIPMAQLQHAVAAIDAGLPLYRVQRLEDALGQQTSSARFGSALLIVFSGGSLLLAAIGLYGLISYLVGLSHREIAIRLALGADSRRVIGLVVGNAMTLVAGGLVVGAAGALAAGRALESQLFQTRATDPSTIVVVASLLLLVTLAATFVPTRRAVRVNPQVALRAE
jgi:putative ABC transport system permease protein